MEWWEQRARNENDPKARSATLLSSYYTTKWFVSSYSGYFRSFPLLFFFLLSLNLLFCLFVNPEKRKWKLVEKVSQQRTEHVTVRKRASSHSNPFSCYGVNNFELKKVFIIKKRFNFVLYTHYSYSYTLLYIAFIFLKKSKYYYSFLITRERWDPPL